MSCEMTSTHRASVRVPMQTAGLACLLPMMLAMANGAVTAARPAPVHVAELPGRPRLVVRPMMTDVADCLLLVH